MRIRDFFDPGSGMEKFRSGIRHKHPGSATLMLMFVFHHFMLGSMEYILGGAVTIPTTKKAPY
jgi:hypothetical protein